MIPSQPPLREMYLCMSLDRYADVESRCWHRRDPSVTDPITRRTFCQKNVSTFLHRTFDLRLVRNQDPHCGTCFPEDWMEAPTPDSMIQIVPPGEDEAIVDLYYTMESGLVDLSREQLRRLAWQALMLSDGPFCTYADPVSDFYQDAHNSMFHVIRTETDLPPGTPTGFVVRGLNGWQT